MKPIRGKVIVLGDDVDTDQILPGYAMAERYEDIGKYAMAGLPDNKFKDIAEPGCIIVAGRNFGCGSSREQAPIALLQAKVAMVVAKSFARIFRRNAINVGLPVFVADISDLVRDGDEIEVDLENGVVQVNSETLHFAPLSENTRKTLEYGGLIPRIRDELHIQI